MISLDNSDICVIICYLITTLSIFSSESLTCRVNMRFLIVVCSLIVATLAQDTGSSSGSGDGTAGAISAGLNLAGSIIQGLNRKLIIIAFINNSFYQM